MNTTILQVFDPPMCCSSGVCGPNVDPRLARFSSDLDWLKKQGVTVERFNLSSNPAIFAMTQVVRDALKANGNACLPILLADGEIVSEGDYPDRNTLAGLCGIDMSQEPDAASINKSETDDASVCGPGCDCGTPSGGWKARMVIGLVVLLTIAGILIYKISNQKAYKADSATQKAGFAVSSAAENVTTENKAVTLGAVVEKKGEADAKITEPAAAENKKTAIDKTKIGEYLDSLGELNKVALNQDAVFIFIPAKKDESPGESTRLSILSAQKKLALSNIKVGLFTMRTSSPDFSTFSSRVQLPAILVACKGRGMGVVSGDVTETKLLQAFMASSQAGGCGTSGCGSSSAGCK
ncbi:MAG: arsenite efflux transporter metallochaperone ArsD [Chloroflexi bacterium]|nr:arsenite efflux transporter metallochaperone ArsD [Chloroflexota bacterium]